MQNLWGLRYIDDLILRDRDSDSNGTLDERLYCLQDPNWNVIAVAGTDGAVVERYSYTAYGTPAFLTSVFGSREAPATPGTPSTPAANTTPKPASNTAATATCILNWGDSSAGTQSLLAVLTAFMRTSATINSRMARTKPISMDMLKTIRSMTLTRQDYARARLRYSLVRFGMALQNGRLS